MLPLFEVTGWSVETEPTPSSSSKKSKKRKRSQDPDAPSEKLESAQVNLEKLMDTLHQGDLVKRPPRKKYKEKQLIDSSKKVVGDKPAVATPSKGSAEVVKPKDVRKPSKKPKETLQTSKEKGKYKPQDPTKVGDSAESNLTALQKGMRKKLDGARFR